MTTPTNGKKTWYIADGYLPYPTEVKDGSFEGHEAVMFLNCNTVDAEVFLDIYYEEKDPVKDIKLTVKAERVKCIRMDRPEDINGVALGRQEQYSLRVRSNINIIVQYGRMDIAQPNLAYIGIMGYAD